MTELIPERMTVAELPEFSRAAHTTFLDLTPEPEALAALRREFFDQGEYWVTKDEGRIVCTIRTFTTPFTVPGGAGATVEVPAHAVTGVTVPATHRRRGLLRRMMTDRLADAREQGHAISVLVAAEWPIYGRYGFWPASRWASARVRARAADLLNPPPGRCRQIELGELPTLAPAVFNAARATVSGNIERDQGDWRRYGSDFLGGKPAPVVIVHEDAAGTVDGYLLWRPVKDFDLSHGGGVRVEELIGASADSRAGLWGYLFGMDLVDEIEVANVAVDDPIPLRMRDGRALTLATNDAVWVRVLDVAGFLAARRYATDDRLVLEIVDDDIGGYAAGRYQLDGGPEGATCTSTPAASAQLRLSQRALAGISLGDRSLRYQYEAGLVDELEPGALARADAMFATARRPWPMTGF